MAKSAEQSNCQFQVIFCSDSWQWTCLSLVTSREILDNSNFVNYCRWNKIFIMQFCSCLHAVLDATAVALLLSLIYTQQKLGDTAILRMLSLQCACQRSIISRCIIMSWFSLPTNQAWNKFLLFLMVSMNHFLKCKQSADGGNAEHCRLLTAWWSYAVINIHCIQAQWN